MIDLRQTIDLTQVGGSDHAPAAYVEALRYCDVDVTDSSGIARLATLDAYRVTRVPTSGRDRWPVGPSPDAIDGRIDGYRVTTVPTRPLPLSRPLPTCAA